jgi:hypothetical protein
VIRVTPKKIWPHLREKKRGVPKKRADFFLDLRSRHFSGVKGSRAMCLGLRQTRFFSPESTVFSARPPGRLPVFWDSADFS